MNGRMDLLLSPYTIVAKRTKVSLTRTREAVCIEDIAGGLKVTSSTSSWSF